MIIIKNINKNKYMNNNTNVFFHNKLIYFLLMLEYFFDKL